MARNSFVKKKAKHKTSSAGKTPIQPLINENEGDAKLSGNNAANTKTSTSDTAPSRQQRFWQPHLLICEDNFAKHRHETTTFIAPHFLGHCSISTLLTCLSSNVHCGHLSAKPAICDIAESVKILYLLLMQAHHAFYATHPRRQHVTTRRELFLQHSSRHRNKNYIHANEVHHCPTNYLHGQ